MLQTNLYDATELKAIETREANEPDVQAILSLLEPDYASSDVYVNVYGEINNRLIRSEKVTTGDADALAEQLRHFYPTPGFVIEIEA
jgi:hypothetical protein